MIQACTILGLDPGLRHTGWGIVAQDGNRLSFIAAGRISPAANIPMATRLCELAEGLSDIVTRYRPDESAIEETFVNKNALSALKLGQARGAAMLALGQAGLSVREYAATRIKQCVTGYGHADKTQVQAMIAMLLPGSGALAADAADALAVAIAHAHHRPRAMLEARMAGAKA
ncbi:MAG: crossover junction endodeoxyribonuclease RuvC [Alphaproteobacteria bacterium]|nr:crossover junction endodeoxyribonuclease RuvC [Alphaproteobacteria bacterium]